MAEGQVEGWGERKERVEGKHEWRILRWGYLVSRILSEGQMII